MRLPLPAYSVDSVLSQALRRELVVARAGVPGPVYCRGPTAARARGDRSARPKGRRGEGCRRRPARRGRAAQGLGAFSWGPNLRRWGAEGLGDFAGCREPPGLN